MFVSSGPQGTDTGCVWLGLGMGLGGLQAVKGMHDAMAEDLHRFNHVTDTAVATAMKHGFAEVSYADVAATMKHGFAEVSYADVAATLATLHVLANVTLLAAASTCGVVLRLPRNAFNAPDGACNSIAQPS